MTEIVEGMAEFQKRLRELDNSMRRQSLIRACRAGGEILRERMKELAPRGASGRLSEEMTMKVSGRESDIYAATVNVGPSRRGFYGRFQEKGTQFHPPQPFMDPALLQTHQQIVREMKQELGKAITRYERVMVRRRG